MHFHLWGVRMPGTYARVFDDREVLEMLHARVKSAGSQVAFSRVTGVSREHLNKVLHGKRAFGPTILEVLNLRIVYAPVGRRSSAMARATDD